MILLFSLIFFLMLISFIMICTLKGDLDRMHTMAKRPSVGIVNKPTKGDIVVAHVDSDRNSLKRIQSRLAKDFPCTLHQFLDLKGKLADELVSDKVGIVYDTIIIGDYKSINKDAMKTLMLSGKTIIIHSDDDYEKTINNMKKSFGISSIKFKYTSKNKDRDLQKIVNIIGGNK